MGVKEKNICPLSLIVRSELMQCSVWHPVIVCDLDKQNRLQASKMFIKADSECLMELTKQFVPVKQEPFYISEA